MEPQIDQRVELQKRMNCIETSVQAATTNTPEEIADRRVRVLKKFYELERPQEQPRLASVAERIRREAMSAEPRAQDMAEGVEEQVGQKQKERRIKLKNRQSRENWSTENVYKESEYEKKLRMELEILKQPRQRLTPKDPQKVYKFLREFTNPFREDHHAFNLVQPPTPNQLTEIPPFQTSSHPVLLPNSSAFEHPNRSLFSPNQISIFGSPQPSTNLQLFPIQSQQQQSLFPSPAQSNQFEQQDSAESSPIKKLNFRQEMFDQEHDIQIQKLPPGVSLKELRRKTGFKFPVNEDQPQRPVSKFVLNYRPAPPTLKELWAQYGGKQVHLAQSPTKKKNRQKIQVDNAGNIFANIIKPETANQELPKSNIFGLNPIQSTPQPATNTIGSLFGNLPKQTQSHPNSGIFARAVAVSENTNRNEPEELAEPPVRRLRIFQQNKSGGLFGNLKESSTAISEQKPALKPEIKESESIFKNEVFKGFSTGKKDQAQDSKKESPKDSTTPQLTKPNKGLFFADVPSIFGKPALPLPTIVTQNKPNSGLFAKTETPSTTQSIFGKPSVPLATQVPQAPNIFGNLNTQISLFNNPVTAAPSTTTASTGLFNFANTQPTTSLFGQTAKQFNFSAPTGNTQAAPVDEEAEDGEGDDGPLEDTDTANPTLSTGKYVYQPTTQIIVKNPGNHFRKNDSQEVFREIVVSLEKTLADGKYNVFIRSTKSKTIVYQGLVVAGQTKAEYINKSKQNVKLLKLVSLENGKPRPDIVKIQFSTEEFGEGFMTAIQKCL